MSSLVSVIMPTYKDKGGLRRAVNSVLSQTYQNIELFVVDDNSPESEWRSHTEKVMLEFSDNPKVHYLKHEVNKNGAAARNTGIKASHGEYIAFLDDDDWFLPEKIEKQVAYLEEHLEYACVYTFELHEDKEFITLPYEGNSSKPLLLLQTQMATSSLCFRTEAVKAINGFDETFRRHQDYEFLLRFFAADYKIGCLQAFLTCRGCNKGENIPTVEKQLELKAYFFEKFQDVIESIDRDDKGFKSQLYAIHYGNVAWYALKQKRYDIFISLMNSYFWTSPILFSYPIRNGISSFIVRRLKRLNNA